MKYHFLPHTADIRMKAEGTSLAALFTAAALGMAQIQKEQLCEQETQLNNHKTLDIEAADTTCLLIDFLSEVLSYSSSESVVYCRFQFLQLSETYLKATIMGKSITEFDEEIKAVTYHEANVVRNRENTLETLVIFDI